jgi:hypothetical protein
MLKKKRLINNIIYLVFASLIVLNFFFWNNNWDVRTDFIDLEHDIYRALYAKDSSLNDSISKYCLLVDSFMFTNPLEISAQYDCDSIINLSSNMDIQTVRSNFIDYVEEVEDGYSAAARRTKNLKNLIALLAILFYSVVQAYFRALEKRSALTSNDDND